MNEIVRTVLVAIGSGVTVSLAAVLLSKRMLDLLVSRLEKRLDSRLELEKVKSEAVVKIDAEWVAEIRRRQMPVYEELSRLAYRGKLAADEIRRARNVFDLRYPDLQDVCRELTTNLVGYRVYLSGTLFDKLHELKHALQDLLIFADSWSRYSTEPQGSPIELSESQRVELKSHCERVEKSYEVAVNQLHTRVGEPAERLSS